MDVSMTAELERFVTEQVESGQYQTADAVIREGLELLRRREQRRLARLVEVRRAIQIAIDRADRGMVTPFDDRTLEAIRAEGRARIEAERASNSP